jgi:erythromycin esterase-like protein
MPVAAPGSGAASSAIAPAGPRERSVPAESSAVAALQRAVVPLPGDEALEAVVARLRHADTVLLGEATHGTHEFYAIRAALSRRLVEAHGFDAIAAEADWADALQVARYVQRQAPAGDVGAALGAFERFPRWMWRNRETRDFVAWLRGFNDARGAQPGVGFFGLDLYSLHASLQAVLRYLQGTDPEAARAARRRYDCFDGLAGDPQRYGYAAHFGTGRDCEREVLEQLDAMFAAGAGDSPDEAFYARQHARVVAGAERYYRTMFEGSTASWNQRDTHMAETLQALRDHLAARLGRPPRVIVWAHNSHVGDARATEFGVRGQLNLGQLVRERPRAFGRSVLLGFSTHAGTVAAASDWDEPVELKRVRPSLPGSVERLMHDTGVTRFLLPLEGEIAARLDGARLQRAIGVIYRPDTERLSHYFDVRLPRQFDLLLHVDETHAVVPLDAPDHWPQPAAQAETYPSGL